MERVISAALVGIGGTIVLDVYSFLMERFFGVAATNWRMVGRWVGHMPRGRFVQPDMRQAEPVPGEHPLGWIFHYLIGIGYGLQIGRTQVGTPVLNAHNVCRHQCVKNKL